jgi:hypothetical protein
MFSSNVCQAGQWVLSATISQPPFSWCFWCLRHVLSDCFQADFRLDGTGLVPHAIVGVS